MISLRNYIHIQIQQSTISMSILSNISDTLKNNKLILIGAALAGAAVYVLYNVAKEEKEQPSQANQQADALDGLLKQINVNNLSIGDLKQILIFTMDLTHKNIAQFQKLFKKQRRINKKANFQTYMNYLADGMTKMQDISVKTQNRVIEKIGISEQKFEQLCMKNPAVFQSIPQPKAINELPELTIQQIRQVFKFQSQYLHASGEELVGKIKSASIGWNQAMKYMIPAIFSVIIADQIYQKFNYQDEQVEQATLKYQFQLTAELNQIRQYLVPLLGQFSQGMQNYYGGQDNYDMDPSMLGGYDPHMGQVPNVDLNPQFLQQMEQMSGDPEMMAKIMAMMQQGQH